MRSAIGINQTEREEIRELIGRRETEGDTERKEADQLFSKFAAYELAFAYLLF